MSTLNIEKKIVKYRVQKPEGEKSEKGSSKDARARKDGAGKVVWMHEKLERPDVLIGSTYKIKTPVSDHAMYVTINDIMLNEGTEHEHRRPFEIFINTKNLDHFQWIVALTRIISAVFRKGGDVAFLTEELKAVFAWRLLAAGRQVHALDRRRARLRRGTAPADHRPDADAGNGRIAPRTDRGQAHRMGAARQANGRVRRGELPGRGATLHQVQHGRGGDDGRVHDLPVLRRVQVRLKEAMSA
jgi:hypothetical protein